MQIDWDNDNTFEDTFACAVGATPVTRTKPAAYGTDGVKDIQIRVHVANTLAASDLIVSAGRGTW